MNESGRLHVVIGLGPVGRAVTDELVRRELRVRAVARHRVANVAEQVELVDADLTDPDSARRAMAGAAVVYHTASAPYHRWPQLLPPLMQGVIGGATATGARVVYADNLYAYGPVDGPLTEDLPYLATGPNGRIRATLAERLMEADRAGRLRATIGRASDFFGPWGRLSTAGERLFEPALAGKPTSVLGDPDLPHTYTYLVDFARGLVTLGTHDEAFGEIWHLPSAATISTREFATLVYRAAGREPMLRIMPAPILTVLALFSPTLRAVREQQYQRDAPWLVDHAKFEAAFGVDVTPHTEAIGTTLDWFRKDGLPPRDARAGSMASRVHGSK